jgi:hypothetical protein
MSLLLCHPQHDQLYYYRRCSHYYYYYYYLLPVASFEATSPGESESETV